MTRVEPAISWARGAIYQALAEALSEPTPGLQDLLRAATMAAARDGASAACRQAALNLVDLPVYTAQRIQQAYQRALNSSSGRPLALYESLHRDGRLAGQATHEVQRRYRSLGLEPATAELPDHASVELAFLGHLATAEGDAWQADERRLAIRLRAERRSFVRTHAALWLPDLGDALAAGDDPLYAAVGCLLRSFLHEEMTMRRQVVRESGGLPILSDATACTLCGLCIGSCPTRALRMIESRDETALTLDGSRCVACSRCAQTCPEEVLLIATPAGGYPSASLPGPWVMRRSARSTCPACGEATVSQAELAAVVTRLGADLETQARMSLCPTCKAIL